MTLHRSGAAHAQSVPRLSWSVPRVRFLRASQGWRSPSWRAADPLSGCPPKALGGSIAPAVALAAHPTGHPWARGRGLQHVFGVPAAAITAGRDAATRLRSPSCFCAISATVLLFARGHCRDFALKASGSFRRGLPRTLPGLCPRRMEQPLHFWSWSGLPCRLSPARRGGCRVARCCAGRSSSRPEGGRRRPGCRG